jgi:ribonuclease G
VTDGVREIMSKTCPTCGGEGVVKSEVTIAIETARRLRELVEKAGKDGPEAYLVRINPRVSAWFTADGARELHALEQQTGRVFHFEGSEGLPLDHLAVTMEGSGEEISEHAVPFRAGEEVHVDIVEPHMYNPDDAVAKIDGYLISVTNGIAFVGEKKLVRIEEAGRTSATAALTGDDAVAAEVAATEREKDRLKAEERAKRSAAAKRGAAARKARQEAAKAAAAAQDDGGKDGKDAKDAKEAKPKRSRRKKASVDGEVEADAVKALADEGAPEAGTAPAAADESSENGDALSSRTRRRGRRGGRRRSRAKASDASES